MLEAYTCLPSVTILSLPQTGGLFRQLDSLHVEVWGEDISEHYLLCYDEQQSHLVDVFYIPFNTQVEDVRTIVD